MKTAPRQPCLYLLLSVSLGIYADRHINFCMSPTWTGLVGLLLLVVLAIAFRARSGMGALLLVGFFVIGATWHHVCWQCFPENEIGRWARQEETPMVLAGVTLTEPRNIAPEVEMPMSFQDREARTVFEFAPQQARFHSEWKPCSGRIIVMVRGKLLVQGGTQVQLTGNLKSVSPPRNPGEFDFRSFYRGQRILAWLYCDSPDSCHILDNQQQGLVGLRSFFRRQLDEVIWSCLDERRAGLASAILLGNREQMDEASRERYLLTGTVHILAISGLHVGILASAISLLLRAAQVSRIPRHLTIIGFVFFYAWLVEFQAPVTRSSVLISLYCLGRILGRPTFSLNLLATSGLVVLAINPNDLFGIGPQLSFLAVFTMSIMHSKPLEKTPVQELLEASRSQFSSGLANLKEYFQNGLTLSASITIVTLPLIAHVFHLVAPVGIIANPLLMLPMATALFGGLLVMTLGWWFEAGGWLGGWLCDLSLTGIQWLVDQSARLPGGHYWTPSPPGWSVILFYVVFVYLGIVRIGFWRIGRLAGWLSLWYLIFWWGVGQLESTMSRFEKAGLVAEVNVMDVGHGNCALLEFPGNKAILLDAGSSASENSGVRRIASSLWSRKITHLEAVFISHADVDHFNALPGICERFSIGTIYVAPNVLESTDPSASYLRSELDRHSIPIEVLNQGDVVEFGSTGRVMVLSPSERIPMESDNSASMVLLVENEGRRMLFPGDIEPPGLDRLLLQPIQPVDFVVAPHHGSMGSRPSQFSSWSRPKLVVISGLKNRISPKAFEHYSQSGNAVISTGQAGAIRLLLTADSLYWQSWLEHSKDGIHWQDWKLSSEKSVK